MAYKLLIIDDEPLVRFGLRSTIKWSDYNIEVVGEAENGIDGLEKIKALQPHIVLTDVKMPLLDGLQMIEKARLLNEEVEFIILSGYGEFEYAKKAFQHDVVNYLLKPIANEELIATILRVIDRIKKKSLVSRSEYVLENSQDEINRKIIRVLVHRHYDDLADLRAQMEMYDINLCEEGLVIVAVIDEEKSQLETFNLLKDFEVIVTNLLHKEQIKYTCGIYHNRLIVVSDLQDVTVAETLMHKALVAYENTSEFTLSLGISGVFLSPLYIARAYEEAKGVASNGLLRFVNSVQIYNGVSQIYNPNLLRVLDIINKEYMEDIDVKAVADKLDVSTSYLMHMLKAEIGITFNTLLIKTRLRQAKIFLSTNEFRINEVAYKVGFNDEKYFSMVFKKYEGMTPSQYMKRHV